MPEINNTNIHSEEVQEIMGFIPKWIVRWGLSLIFSVFLIIIAGSYFFKFPEVVTAPIVITTQNPPAALVSKFGGQIKKWFVTNGEKVLPGDLIALIKNNAEYKDVQAIQFSLGKLTCNWEEDVFKAELPVNLVLGDIQNSYVAYEKWMIDFKNYLIQDDISVKIDLLEKQINKKKEYYQILISQKKLQEEDLKICKKIFTRDSILYVKGVEAQAKHDLSKQTFLQKESAYLTFQTSLKNTESTILQLQEAKIELEIQCQKEKHTFIANLHESKQILENQINTWIEKYMLRSPINGTVTFTKFWSENQVINAGERLASIVPEGENKIIGTIQVPSSGFGKIRIGQKVNIKLNGFPYMEYGMLRAEVESLSLVPEEQYYIVAVNLDKGMQSSYSEKLKFIQGMDGTADIITKDRRLITRFISPLRAFFDNGE